MHTLVSGYNPSNNFFTRKVGEKHYELTDHASTTLSTGASATLSTGASTALSTGLGNVRATVTDRKIASFQYPQAGNWTITGFTADITSAQDYYPFGWTMLGRQFNPDEYRYGFNGKKKYDEIKGTGSSLDFNTILIKWVMVFMLASQLCVGQSVNADIDFILLDTIRIEEPVLVVFSNARKHKPFTVLTSKESLNALEHRKKRKAEKFILERGFYAFGHISAISFLQQRYESNRILIKDLEFHLNEGHKTTGRGLFVNREKHSRKIDVYHTEIKSYIVFLVLASKLNEWTTSSSLKIQNVDNLYVPVAIPAGWLE